MRTSTTLALAAVSFLTACTAQVVSPPPPAAPADFKPQDLKTQPAPAAADWTRCEQQCVGQEQNGAFCTESGRRYANLCLALCLEGNSVPCK